jgi:cyclopropane fatty-acyl-phospholipid synthase-like methyltransferase
MRNLIKDHYYENRFGIETGDIYLFKDNMSLNRDGLNYEPASYVKLEKIIEYLNLCPADICVDIGCGKGRVVFFLALHRVKKVIGIELLEELATIAKENLKKFRIKNNKLIEIIQIDAVDFDFSKCTIFYLFNPFGYRTLEKVVDNIEKGLVNNPRKIRILYVNPVHRIILDNTCWLVFEGKIDKTDAYVWHNRVD